MTPFALAIRDEGFDQLKIYQPNDQVEIESLSNIQTHTVDLRLLVCFTQLFESFFFLIDSFSTFRPLRFHW